MLSILFSQNQIDSTLNAGMSGTSKLLFWHCCIASDDISVNLTGRDGYVFV